MDAVQPSHLSNSLQAGGNVTAIREYAFGTATGAPGDNSRDVTGAQLLRSTTRTYLHNSFPNYVPRNIVSKVLSEVVVDNTSGATASQTQYEYDDTGILATPNLSAVPGHDSTFTSSFTLRGNPTFAKHLNNVNNSFIATAYNYDDLGNIRSIIDPLGHTTTWVYDDSFDSATNTCAPLQQ
jgi:YD repeat-containing protein